MEQDTNVLVSVITVCYNSSATIRRTIESILRQSYTNIEYIVVDGNSEDNTVEIVNGYQESFNKRFHRPIRIISEPDQGIYDAMNKGIKIAAGRFIGIINSDDAYEPYAVSMVVKNASDTPMQICYGGIKTYRGEQLESIIFYSHEFMEERMIAHPACFVSKDVYDKYGTYNIRYISAADYEFMLRVYNKEGITFTPIYEPLADYYLGGISTTYRGFRDKYKMLYEAGKMGRWVYWRRIALLKLKVWSRRKK